MARTEVRSLRVTTDARQAQQSFAELDRRIGRVGEAGENMSRRVRQSGESFGNLAQQSTGLTRSLDLVKASLAGIGATLAVDAIAGYAQEITELANSADRLGIAVEEIQVLGRVATSTGLALEDFTEAFITQQELISEAAREGSGTAAEALAEMGISAQGLINLKADEQFRVLAEAISQVENEADQTRLAIKLWQTEGAKLLPILKQGAAGFDELAQEARNAGGIMSGETVESVRELQKEITLAGERIKGTLLPVITTVIEGWALMAEQGERAFLRITNAFGLFKNETQQSTDKIRELSTKIKELRDAQTLLDNADGFDPTGKAAEAVARLKGEIEALNKELGRGEFAKLTEETDAATDVLDAFADKIQSIGKDGLQDVSAGAETAAKSTAKLTKETRAATKALKDSERAAEDAARAYERQGREINQFTGGLGSVAARILNNADDIQAELDAEARPAYQKFWDDLGEDGQRAGQNVASMFVTEFARGIQTGDVRGSLVSAVEGAFALAGAAIGGIWGGPIGAAAGGAVGATVGGLLGGVFGGGNSRDSYPISFFPDFGDFGADAGPGAGPYQNFVKAIDAMDAALKRLMDSDEIGAVTEALAGWGPIMRRMEEGAFDTQEAFDAIRVRFKYVFEEAFPEYLSELENLDSIEELAELIDEITRRTNAIASVADTFGLSLEEAEEKLDALREDNEEYAETLARVSEALQAADSALSGMETIARNLASVEREISQSGQTAWQRYIGDLKEFRRLSQAGASDDDLLSSLTRVLAGWREIYNLQVKNIEESARQARAIIEQSFKDQLDSIRDYYDTARDAARDWYDEQREAAEEWYDQQSAIIEARREEIDAEREIIREAQRVAETLRRSAEAAARLIDNLTYSEASPESASQRYETISAEIDDLDRRRAEALAAGDLDAAAELSDKLAKLLEERLSLGEEIFQRGSTEYARLFEETIAALEDIASQSQAADQVDASAAARLAALERLEEVLADRLESLRDKLDERFRVLDEQLSWRLANIDRHEQIRFEQAERARDRRLEENAQRREAALKSANERYRENVIGYQNIAANIYRRQLQEQQRIVENTRQQVGLTQAQTALLQQILATLKAQGVSTNRTASVSRTNQELRYG